MFEGLISFASVGYFQSGSFGSILAQWEQQGIFAYVVPFLLIFALIYGLLIKLNIFGDENSAFGRTINAIIAFSVSLLSLQFDLVPRFFSEVFPRLGVGLAVLILAIILLGMFAPKKWIPILFFIVGMITFIVILSGASSSFGWSPVLGNIVYFAQQNIGLILFIGVIIAIVASSVPLRPKNNTDFASRFSDLLTGGSTSP